MSSDQLIERWCKDHATPATVQWLVDHFEPAEGSSIRRSILYNFYLEHCLNLKVEPLNPASFGKLIHSVFLGLKTRRLGTRGNSKYHYYGIQVKSSSSLSKKMLFDSECFLLSNTNNDFDYSNSDAHLNLSPNEYSFSPNSTNQNSFAEFYFLQEPTHQTNDFSSEIHLDDMKLFQKSHDDYANRLLQNFLHFQFDLIEKSMQQFWSLTNINSASTNEFIHSDSTIVHKFQRLCTLPAVIDQFRSFYGKFYQTILDHYFPDVFTSLTSNTIDSIRTIGTEICLWLTRAIEHLYEPLKIVLHQYTQSFSSILLRYTTLNHLSLTVQSMFQQSSRLITMANDLTEINFQDLHEQINWLIDCDLNLFMKIEQCLKNLFHCQATLNIQHWITFIETLLDDYLSTVDNLKDYISHSRQFILKSNFYCSLILRDLTLQHGASLGSFHLLQLFIEEFLYYRLEQKIAVILNQSVFLTVVENREQRQQTNLRNKNYQDLFIDDEIEDDFESFTDDFLEHRTNGKPLSPVAIDDDLLAETELVQSSFSYIFEDLQPLNNEMF